MGVDLTPFINAVRVVQPRHQLEFELLHTPFLGPAAPASGGIQGARKVALENGWIAYVKAFEPYNVTKAHPYHGSDDPCGPLFEAVAWRLADALGGPVAQIVQPVVLRPFEEVLSSVGLGARGKTNQLAAVLPTPAAMSAAFFDCLIGQQDRNVGNFKWEPAQRRLGLFDHAFAFARHGDHFQSGVLQAQRHDSDRRRLTDWEQQALRRLLDAEDALGVAPMLPADRLAALLARAEWMLAEGEILLPATVSRCERPRGREVALKPPVSDADERGRLDLTTQVPEDPIVLRAIFYTHVFSFSQQSWHREPMALLTIDDTRAVLRGPRADEIPIDMQILDAETAEQVLFRQDPLRWLELFARDHSSGDLDVEIQVREDVHDVGEPVVEQANELVAA